MCNYRIWKLGSLEHGIYPTEAARRLADILSQAIPDEDSCLDIIWGPDLEVQDVKHGDDIEECVVEEIKEDGDKVTFVARKVKAKEKEDE